MKKYVLIIAAFTGILLASCTKDNVSQYSASGGNCTDTISFAHKIAPLISQGCATAGCHDNVAQAGGYSFTSHGTIAANAQVMLSAMRWEGGVQMPQGQPQLPDSLIQQFACWIDQGKQDN